MHAVDLAEPAAAVALDSDALAAVRLLAEQRLPAIVVTGADGAPHAILAASQVVRFLVPQYVQDDPSLARVLDEPMADRIAGTLRGRTVGSLLPAEPAELPRVDEGDTIVEVAAVMARLHCPLVAVMRERSMRGVISASGLLQHALAQS